VSDFLAENVFQPLGMEETFLRSGFANPGKLTNPYAAFSDGSPFNLLKLQIFEVTFSRECQHGHDENVPKVVQVIFSYISHPPKLGAYTELWAGLSPDVRVADGGRYAIPWGRWHSMPRKDILDALKTKQEGGTGQAAEFWKWCEDQTKEYA
jgi:CubicO group peptidase (beta-lactamase class C family)